jgi:hypothetical protein
MAAVPKFSLASGLTAAANELLDRDCGCCDLGTEMDRRHACTPIAGHVCEAALHAMYSRLVSHPSSGGAGVQGGGGSAGRFSWVHGRASVRRAEFRQGADPRSVLGPGAVLLRLPFATRR